MAKLNQEDALLKGLEGLEDIYKEQVAFFNIEDKANTFIITNSMKTMAIIHENKIKILDVLIDILKFAIPINFTVWISSYSFNKLMIVSSWVIGALLSLVLFLFILIILRYRATERYISDYKRYSFDFIEAYQNGTYKEIKEANKLRKKRALENVLNMLGITN